MDICGDYKYNEVPKDFIDNCVAYKDMMHGFPQKTI
jgi:hypothetical protein